MYCSGSLLNSGDAIFGRPLAAPSKTLMTYYAGEYAFYRIRKGKTHICSNKVSTDIVEDEVPAVEVAQ